MCFDIIIEIRVIPWSWNLEEVASLPDMAAGTWTQVFLRNSIFNKALIPLFSPVCLFLDVSFQKVTF